MTFLFIINNIGYLIFISYKITIIYVHYRIHKYVKCLVSTINIFINYIKYLLNLIDEESLFFIEIYN